MVTGLFTHVHTCRHVPASGTYSPHNKEWLKEKIFGMLKKQAGGSKR